MLLLQFVRSELVPTGFCDFPNLRSILVHAKLSNWGMAYFSVLQAKYPSWVEITTSGFTLSSYRTINTYSWSELDDPKLVSLGRAGRFIKFESPSIILSPSQFRCRDDEMLEILKSARSGQLISPDQWRREHPFRRWKTTIVIVGLLLLVLIIKFGPVLLK
jgi:hypothetical protein